MQGKSYMERLNEAAKAQDHEKFGNIAFEALTEISNKISLACAGYESDIAITAVALRMFADEYEKSVPAEMRDFMCAFLNAAQTAGKSINIRLPGAFIK